MYFCPYANHDFCPIFPRPSSGAAIHEQKRQRLIPFPRVGKRQALIPFPRTGKRSSSAPLNLEEIDYLPQVEQELIPEAAAAEGVRVAVNAVEADRRRPGSTAHDPSNAAVVVVDLACCMNALIAAYCRPTP